LSPESSTSASEFVRFWRDCGLNFSWNTLAHEEVSERKLEVVVSHLSSTVKDILALSNIEANKLVLENNPVHLAELIADVACMVQDTGIGMTSATISKIFTPFVQAAIREVPSVV